MTELEPRWWATRWWLTKFMWLMAGLTVLVVGVALFLVRRDAAEEAARRRCDAAVRNRVQELIRNPAASATLGARQRLEHRDGSILIQGNVDINGVNFKNALGNNHDRYYCEVVDGVIKTVDVSSGR